MTALCPSSGPSQVKPSSPASIFITSQGATSILEAILGAADPFADLIVFAAGQTLDLTTFCASDPPAMPTFSASDIADIIAMFPGASTPGAAKILDMMQNLAWYTYCECVTGSPTTVTTPTYPSGGPVLSNPGTNGTPTQSTQSCFNGTDTTTYGFTSVGIAYNTEAAGINPPDGSVTTATIQVLNHVFTAPGYTITLTGHAQNSSNTDLITPVSNTVGPGATSSVTISIPAGTTQVLWNFRSTSGSGASQLWSPTLGSVGVDWSYYCNGALPGGDVSPCCPPDQNLNSLLNQILNELNFIYSNLPVRTPSYDAGAAYTGLSGTGNQTLTATCIAVRVDVTTLPGFVGENSGTPDFFFDLGYLTPETNQGPVSATRLTYETQVIPLPDATDSIDYTLLNGTVVTITELQAG